MGSYLNPGSKGFRKSLNSEIYVDKTGLIEKTNAVLNTRQKFLCVSRPRRFGKSMAADMLAAYYDRRRGFCTAVPFPENQQCGIIPAAFESVRCASRSICRNFSA